MQVYDRCFVVPACHNPQLLRIVPLAVPVDRLERQRHTGGIAPTDLIVSTPVVGVAVSSVGIFGRSVVVIVPTTPSASSAAVTRTSATDGEPLHW